MQYRFFLCLLIFALPAIKGIAQVESTVPFPDDTDHLVNVSPWDTIFSVLPPGKSQALVPWHSTSGWGLADTNGKIVCAPEFDEVLADFEYQHVEAEGDCHQLQFSAPVKDHYIVRKGKKYGLISTIGGRGKLIIPPRFDDLYFKAGNFVIARQEGRRGILFNLSGQQLLNDSVRDVKEVYYNLNEKDCYLFEFRGEEKSAVFKYNIRLQKIISWLTEDDGLILTRNCGQEKTIFIGYLNGNEQYKRLKSDLRSHKNIIENLSLDDFEKLLNTDHFTFVNASELEFPKFEKKITMVEYSIEKMRDTILLISKTRGYNYRVAVTHDTVLMVFDSAGIHPFGKHSYHTSEPYNRGEFGKYDSLYYYHNYVIYHTAGKKGLIAEKKVIPAVFDRISYVNVAYRKPSFIVALTDDHGRLRWGMISSDGQSIIPCIYDTIITNTTNQIAGYGPESLFLIRLNGLYGIIKASGAVELPTEYDAIINQNNSMFSFILKKNQYFGFYSSYCKAEAIYETPVDGCEPNWPVPLYKVNNSDGTLRGYMSKSGKKFFD